MSLRIIEPERPGFDSRTFECPKCYDTETFVASISREINDSILVGSRAASAFGNNGNTGASIDMTASRSLRTCASAHRGSSR
jgi:hypothetical protein